MSGVSFQVRLDGIAGVQAALAALRDLGEDMTPVYDEIGAAMVASQQNRFQLGIEPDGTPWMPSWRAREEGGKTLIDTGLLLSRLTHNADASGAEWGFNDRRAATLHFGAVITPKAAKALAFTGSDGRLIFAQNVVIPARPMVGVDDADIREVGDIVAAAAERAASRASEASP